MLFVWISKYLLKACKICISGCRVTAQCHCCVNYKRSALHLVSLPSTTHNKGGSAKLQNLGSVQFITSTLVDLTCAIARYAPSDS